MSGFNEQDLIQFWKDANSYQSIDVACFDVEEFKNNWIRDKIGHEALEKASGVTAGEKQCNLPVVNGWLLYDFPENMPLYKDSGLWQLRSDDMEEVVLQQGVNESDNDFIVRCKACR